MSAANAAGTDRLMGENGQSGGARSEAQTSPRLRKAEFVALYLAFPVVHATFHGTLGTFGPLLVLVAAGCFLLAVTPGFSWRELVDLRGLARWLPLFLGFLAACIVAIFGLVLLFVPDQLFGFPRRDPVTWGLVMLLYPPISVLGQELIFRPLFYRRYGDLFPSETVALFVNAAVFSLAHAFYQNWIAVSLTFAGGLVFAWAYQRSGSFALVFILHTLAGHVLFTSGLGAFFYHGAIPQG
jgi:uncharacterized protein